MLNLFAHVFNASMLYNQQRPITRAMIPEPTQYVHTATTLSHDRSINNKTLCMREFIIDNNLDILFLCETWLGTDYDETSISEFFPPGYKLLHQAPTNQRAVVWE